MNSGDNRVLAFGCHPDDVEFQCSGTLALLAELGYEIHIAVMSGGEAGSPTLSPQEIHDIRMKESAEAAAVLNGHFHYACGHDVDIEYNADLRRQAIRVVREVDPFLILTHPPMDYMIDHEETSRLVRNAAYVASVPNVDCGVPTIPTRRIPHLYYWNANGRRDIFGRPLPVNRVVDITKVIETKATMLACHRSQNEWLNYHNQISYIDLMKQDGVEQGKLIGVDYGESYIQHLGNHYPQVNILKSILGDLCFEL